MRAAGGIMIGRARPTTAHEARMAEALAVVTVG
jgi:hypothetical protein